MLFTLDNKCFSHSFIHAFENTALGWSSPIQGRSHQRPAPCGSHERCGPLLQKSAFAHGFLGISGGSQPQSPSIEHSSPLVELILQTGG